MHFPTKYAIIYIKAANGGIQEVYIMAICTNCGAPVEGQFCTNCGAAAPKAAGPAPIPQQNFQNPAPVYNNITVSGSDNATSVGGWIGWMFLLSFFPLIGQIIMLACSKDPSAKNFAKAQLILTGIILGLFLLFFILIFVLAGASST